MEFGWGAALGAPIRLLYCDLDDIVSNHRNKTLHIRLRPHILTFPNPHIIQRLVHWTILWLKVHGSDETMKGMKISVVLRMLHFHSLLWQVKTVLLYLSEQINNIWACQILLSCVSFSNDEWHPSWLYNMLLLFFLSS